MLDTNDNNRYIIPYCLCSKFQNGVEYRTILNPVYDKMTGRYQCDIDQSLMGWKLIYTFYAISPMFRPIPSGMKLFRVIINNETPNNAKDFHAVLDPYYIKNDSLYFITYNKKVIGTRPIYMYRYGESLYPSLVENGHPVGYTPADISVIYVMDKPYDSFRCLQGKPTPWIESEWKSLYPIYTKTGLGIVGKPISFGECVMECNEYHIGGDGTSVFMTLEDIMKEDSKIPILAILILAILVLASISVFIIRSNKK